MNTDDSNCLAYSVVNSPFTGAMLLILDVLILDVLILDVLITVLDEKG